MSDVDKLVFQANFGGHPHSIRPSVQAVLNELAVNILSRGDPSMITDLEGEIEQAMEGYRAFLGEEAAPNLTHALCLELLGMEGDYESLDIHVHDPYTPLGHESQIESYDMLMPQDPSFWLVEAIHAIKEDGIGVEEARERLEDNIRRTLYMGTHDHDGSVALPKFVRREELFGYPEGDRRNMFHQPFDGDEPFRDQVVFRALAKFDALVQDLGIGLPRP